MQLDRGADASRELKLDRPTGACEPKTRPIAVLTIDRLPLLLGNAMVWQNSRLTLASSSRSRRTAKSRRCGLSEDPPGADTTLSRMQYTQVEPASTHVASFLGTSLRKKCTPKGVESGVSPALERRYEKRYIAKLVVLRYGMAAFRLCRLGLHLT